MERCPIPPQELNEEHGYSQGQEHTDVFHGAEQSIAAAIWRVDASLQCTNSSLIVDL